MPERVGIETGMQTETFIIFSSNETAIVGKIAQLKVCILNSINSLNVTLKNVLKEKVLPSMALSKNGNLEITPTELFYNAFSQVSLPELRAICPKNNIISAARRGCRPSRRPPSPTARTPMSLILNILGQLRRYLAIFNYNTIIML